MHKLLRASHGYFSSSLKDQITSAAKTLSRVSHFHDRGESIDFVLDKAAELPTAPKPTTDGLIATSESNSVEDCQLQISHPWPEWVGLMECLINTSYFDCDENMLRGRTLGLTEVKLIRSACLNFSRDRVDLIGFLSRKHIEIVAACGCPSLDRKVVNSGKRLRFHVGIDEENTCRSCNLRGDCDSAYLKPRKEEDGRTVDVMRMLLTYGLDPIAGTVENKPCLNKLVENSVRILLKELVEYSKRSLDNVEAARDSLNAEEKGPKNDSRKWHDWLCPRCNFLNFARNLRCLQCNCFNEEKLKKLKEDCNHLPLLKGDWICNTCNFLNFARNLKCMQCKENPSNRKINPGDWECPSCNYINFRSNMSCLKCDHSKLKSANSENNHNNLTHLENTRSRVHEGDNVDVSALTCAPQQNQSFKANNLSSMEDESCQDLRIEAANYFRSMEDESCQDLRNEASDFLDFPITGGKGDLSRNIEKRETWKQQMLEKRKCDVFKVIKDEEFRAPSVPRRFELSNPEDDEEMSEWFGP